jgi:Flp pilus assembly protein TadD
VGTWKEVPLPSRSVSNRYFAFSADSKILALGDSSPGVVRLIDPEIGQELLRISTPEVSRLAPGTFALGDARLVTVGLDSTSVHVIDLHAIREKLMELDLDWDARPLSMAASKRFEPIQIDFDSKSAIPQDSANVLIKKATQLNSEMKHFEALKALRQAVTTEPTHAQARNDLAWFLSVGPAELRNPKEALAAARTAVALEKRPTYFNTLGVALYRNQEFKEALEVLNKSVSMSNGATDAFDLYFLAMCHHRIGDGAKATDCFERAQRWVEARRGKLSQDWRRELTDFEAEAKRLLAPPAGTSNKSK